MSLERFQHGAAGELAGTSYRRKRGYDRDNANTNPARSDSWSLGDLTIDLCLGGVVCGVIATDPCWLHTSPRFSLPRVFAPEDLVVCFLRSGIQLGFLFSVLVGVLLLSVLHFHISMTVKRLVFSTSFRCIVCPVAREIKGESLDFCLAFFSDPSCSL